MRTDRISRTTQEVNPRMLGTILIMMRCRRILDTDKFGVSMSYSAAKPQSRAATGGWNNSIFQTIGLPSDELSAAVDRWAIARSFQRPLAGALLPDPGRAQTLAKLDAGATNPSHGPIHPLSSLSGRGHHPSARIAHRDVPLP